MTLILPFVPVILLVVCSSLWLSSHGLSLVVLSITTRVRFLFKIRIFVVLLLTRWLWLRFVASLVMMSTITVSWCFAPVGLGGTGLAASVRVVHRLMLILIVPRLLAGWSEQYLILMRLALLTMAFISSTRLTTLRIRILVIFLRLHRPAIPFLAVCATSRSSSIDIQVLLL